MKGFSKTASLIFALIAFASAIPFALRDEHRYHRHHPRIFDQYFYMSRATPGILEDGIGDGTDSYIIYKGDGTPRQGWPTTAQWVSFENMFNNSIPMMKESCSDLENSASNAAPDTDEEIRHIHDAIQAAAYRSGVDHRFILAIIMQESGGCVRVHTTSNGHTNPGLMQDDAGTSSCYTGANAYHTPCPAEQIYGMIYDGVRGTAAGDGLAGLLTRAYEADRDAAPQALLYYRAARLYNSGRVDVASLEAAGSATACYVSDVANRLTGWTRAENKCVAVAG